MCYFHGVSLSSSGAWLPITDFGVVLSGPLYSSDVNYYMLVFEF